MKNVPAVKKIHMPQEDAFTAHDCNKVETLLDFFVAAATQRFYVHVLLKE